MGYYQLERRLDKLDEQIERVARHLSRLVELKERMEYFMATLDDLRAQVSAQSTIVDSVLTLVQGLADKVAAAGTDSAALQAIVDDLRAQDEKLAGAVAANTPASPPAEPPAEPAA